MLGGAVGDALGAPVEFLSTAQIEGRFGAAGVRDFEPARFDDASGVGLVTDDTQMTMFTIEGLIRARTRGADRGIVSVPSVVGRAYLRWYATQTVERPIGAMLAELGGGWLARETWLYSQRAPGTTCLDSLRLRAEGDDGEMESGNDSEGCGAVMRSAPFGWLSADLNLIWDIAVESAAYTHGHANAQDPAGALAALVALLLRGESLEKAVEQMVRFADASSGNEDLIDLLQAAQMQARAAEPSVRALESLGEGWTGHEALAIAVYAALSWPEPQQVLEALSLAVSHGGDSDSTGSICGNILGALHGEHFMPAHLVYRLEGRQTMLTLVDDFLLQLRDGFTPTAQLPVLVGRVSRDAAERVRIHETAAWFDRYPGN